MTANRKTKLFYGYIMVAAALFIMTLAWGALFCIGVFFKPMLEELELTRAATSIAQSISILLTGFVGIFLGRLNDRLGPRLIVTAGGLFLGAGYLLMSLTETSWQLYLFRGVLVGIGMSGTYVPLLSTIAKWFYHRRGLMMGIIISGVGLGTTVMPPLANWLISNYGWRDSYIILGAAILISVILAAQFLKRDPADAGQFPYGGVEAKQEKVAGLSPQRVLQTTQLWLLCFIFLFFDFCADAVLVHIVPHITDFTISAASAASILAVLGVVSIPGRIVMGNAGDRVGSKLTMLICFAVMLTSFVWLLFAREEWAFYLFAIAFGFPYGGLAALMSLVVAELFGLSAIGLILGIVTCGATIGAAAGPALAGFIFDATGSYQLVYIICTALSAVCVVLTLLLKPVTGK